MIKKISEIKIVDVIPVTFDNLKGEVFKDILLPFILKGVSQWECHFLCNSCKKTICYDRVDNSSTFISGVKLINTRFRKEKLFECLGQIFKLEKVSIARTPKNYSYFVDKSFGDSVSDLGLVDYFKCPFCKRQYLFGYMMRSDEPNYGVQITDTNLYGLFEVEMSEQDFFSEEYKGS